MTSPYRTLLLDTSWRPIRVISWMRALILSEEGRAILVDTYPDAPVRSPSQEFARPAVVALKHYHGYRSFKVRFSKKNVYIRDDFTCQYCGKQFPLSKLTIDHIIPRSKGGKNDWRNVVAACGPCNHKKGDRTPDQAGLPLLSVPRVPEVRGHNTLGAAVPEQWVPYLGDLSELWTG